MSALALWLVQAHAQEYRFPAAEDQAVHWYPTAYLDHGGRDWNCGTIRYNGHRGSDFGGGGFAGMDAGRRVHAAAPGVVATVVDGEFDRCTSADCAGGGGFGNYVRLDHPDGRSTFYAHLKKWSIQVAVGDVVPCGGLLGEMGSSGFSTGPHLHFEVRDADSNRQDPFLGACSPSPNTSWVDQGAHGDLPGRSCGAWPACAPVEALTCGDRVVGRNDGPGSTNTHQRYGCGTWTYTGAETAFTVRTDRDEPVTLRLSGLTADLDLYVLASEACDTLDCLAAGDGSATADEEVVVDARAGVPLTAVVDGFRGVSSPFVLEVVCAGLWPPPEDTPPVSDTGAPPDSADTDAPEDTGPEADPARCGCAAGGVAPGAFGFLLFAPLLRRRLRAGGAGAWRQGKRIR